MQQWEADFQRRKYPFGENAVFQAGVGGYVGVRGVGTDCNR
jgi:hypothetical protein